MPGVTLSPYEQVPVTKQALDWAELVTLDLSLWDTPNGKDKLAKKLQHALQHVGFFYVKNFGLTQEEVDRQFALGRAFFELPLEEKLKFFSEAERDAGEYNGYRPPGQRKLTEGLYSNIELYNIPKFDGFHKREHPQIFQDHIEEIEKFHRTIHEQVVLKLLRIFAIVLELPDEEQLAKGHKYDEKGEDHLRYMLYNKRTPEENQKLSELYVPGHSDLGSLTLLFRQPVAGLQILNSNNEWKWVKPVDATITVNVCDALSAITAGYFKSSIHRVHTPPADQAHLDRLGILYFSRPNDTVLMDPISNSPLLNRLNLKTNEFVEAGHNHLTVKEYVKVRQQRQGKLAQAPRVTEDGKFEFAEKGLESFPGVKLKIYN